MPVALKFTFLYAAFVLIRPQEFVSFLQGIPVMPFLLIMTAFSWLFSKKYVYFDHLKIFFLLIIYVIFTYLMFVGLDQLSEVIILMMTIYILFGVISSQAINENHIRTFLWLILISAIIMSVHSIEQSLYDVVSWTGVKILYEDGNPRVRYIGIFNDPNDLGMMLAASLPVAVYFFIRSKNILLKLILLSGFVSIVYSIHLTDSRGTVLTVIVIVMLFLQEKIGKKKTIVIGLMLLPILFALSTRMNTINTEDESAAGRIDAWSEGLKMLQYSLYMGVGYKQFTEYHFRTAHNSYILAMAELGVIGYFLWLKIIVSPFMALRELRTRPELTKVVDSRLMDALYFMGVGLFSASFFLSRTFLIPLFIVSALTLALINSYVHDKIILESDIKGSFSNIYWFKLSLLSMFLLWLVVKILL